MAPTNQPPIPGWLVVMHPPRRGLIGKLIQLDRTPMRVGTRASNQIQVEGSGVEPEHARISCERGRWCVCAIGESRVLLNRSPLAGRRELEDGDLIQIGCLYFGFLLDMSEERRLELRFRLNSRDAALGVLNKKAWAKTLKRECGKAFRHRLWLSVAVLRFDEVPELHSEFACEQALAQLCQFLQPLLYEDECLGRLSRTVVGLTMPGVGRDLAEARMRRLRQAAFEHAFSVPGVPARLGLAVVVSSAEGDALLPEPMFNAAISELNDLVAAAAAALRSVSSG